MMSSTTGLLIGNSPNNIGNLFKQLIQRDNLGTLYVKLLSEVKAKPTHLNKENLRINQEVFRKNVCNYYNKLKNENLDVRVLLSNFRNTDFERVTTCKAIEVVYFDSSFSASTIESFIHAKVTNKAQSCRMVSYMVNNNDSDDSFSEIGDKNSNLTSYDHVVLGGTFDKLHVGHKILFSEAVMRCQKKLVVGVIADSLLQSKILPELIDDCQTRIKIVTEFLKDIDPSLEYDVVPIYDIYGPTKTDSSFQMIVVSKETVGGAVKINEYREKVGLNKLIIETIDLIDSDKKSKNEEAKMSSSNYRMRLLSTLLKSPEPRPNLPPKPYIIGLTGGIASGKSSISGYLKALGCECINCDEVTHEMYKTGSEGHEFIKETFGSVVLNEDGSINRRQLSATVFGNNDLLTKLSNGLWPLILKAVKRDIYTIHKDKKVVVIEAALLIKANWVSECHEVWSCIIPLDEAVKRLQNRNNLSVEEARKRIDSQPKNKEYVAHSNIVFCTLWDTSYTQAQVQKAWEDLQKRLIEI